MSMWSIRRSQGNISVIFTSNIFSRSTHICSASMFGVGFCSVQLYRTHEDLVNRINVILIYAIYTVSCIISRWFVELQVPCPTYGVLISLYFHPLLVDHWSQISIFQIHELQFPGSTSIPHSLESDHPQPANQETNCNCIRITSKLRTFLDIFRLLDVTRLWRPIFLSRSHSSRQAYPLRRNIGKPCGLLKVIFLSLQF